MSTLAIISSIVVLLVVFSVLALFISFLFRVVVETNMVHIVQKRNHTVAYGKGKDAGNTYYKWPEWIPVIGVTVTEFPESIFQVNLDKYSAYDAARVPFIVDVASFFRLEDATIAAQRVESFKQLNDQLTSVLQGSVRRILATNTLEKIMESRAELGQQFTEEVRSQLSEWGVIPVKTIEFMDLRDAPDSQVIANIMAKEQSRINMESRIAVATNMQEAQLKEIDAQRTVDVQKQDAEQQVGQRTAEKEKIVGVANEQSKQEIKEAAKITAEKEMAVKQVQEVKAAEIKKQVAEVQANQDKSVQVVAAEAHKDATVIKATGDLESAKLNAQGIEAEGKAKGVAEQAILMAPVNTQIELAREIGGNDGYQKYLVTIEQVKVNGEVGKAMASALSNADVRVIANGNTIEDGITSVPSLLTSKLGVGLASVLEGLSSSDAGLDVVNKITGTTQSKE